MFKKWMAKVGIGAATVDLRLDKEAYRLGETVTGVIHIEGGNVEQRISTLSVQMIIKAYIKGQSLVRTVQTIPVLSNFTVQPKPFGQEVPFQLTLPHDLAVTTHSIEYFFQTVLDVEQALDPTDTDRFVVLPPVHIEKALRSLQLLDFRMKPDSGKLTRYGQEFSFFPGRPLSVPLRELEVIFFEEQDQLRLLVELDVMKGNGLYRREVEQKAEITIPRDMLANGTDDEVARYLLEKIEYYLNNPQAVAYFSMAPYKIGQRHGHHRGLGMGGMIGGVAAGLIGGMLLEDAMEGVGEMMGMDDIFGGDEGGDGGGDFGDFDM